MTRGQVRVDVAVTGFEGIVEHEASCADDGPEGCAEGTAETYVHRVEVPWLRVEPALAVGVANGWHVQASFPYDLRYRRVRYTLPDGSDYAPADPELHHASGLQTGLTDGRLMVWHGAKEDPFSWAIGFGTTLPLGRGVPDPYRLEAAGLPHEHLLFGSGVFVPVFTARLGVDGARWGGGFQLDIREPLYENRQGYRPPEVLSRSLGLSWRATPRLSMLASWDRSRQDEEKWNGVEHGGMHMYGVAMGVLWQVRPTFGLVARVRYNFAHVAYETFGDEQIRKPVMFTLAGSWEGTGWTPR